MTPHTQRKITYALFAAVAVAFGVQRYLRSRPTFNFVTEQMPFTVTNDVAYFRGTARDYVKTNAELAALLKRSQARNVIVTVRERRRSGQLVGWKVTDVDVPAVQP